jgi:DNA-binding transcriptional regulator YhcF (GntR family)
LNALPTNIVEFKLPKKPKVREKQPAPDQRKVSVLPIRAVFDQKLTHGGLQVLAAICAFSNRAGITWVSQTRLAKDLGISQQAVAKQFKQLRALGYLETVRKGFKGERTDTIRVIFDPSVDVATAIAVTSSIEDTRPPEMRKEQQMEQNNSIDPAGLKRIQDMIKGVVKPVQPPAKEYQMPKGDTVTVAKMKKEIAAAKARKERLNHNPEVVNEEAVQLQPNHNLEVVLNPKERTNKRLLRDVYLKEVKESYLELLHNSMSDDEIEVTLQDLQQRCQAEGVSMPTDGHLVEAILVTHGERLIR